MALLGSLNEAIDPGKLTALISVQVDGLSKITAALHAPPDLTKLGTELGQLALPRGDGLAALPERLTELRGIVSIDPAQFLTSLSPVIKDLRLAGGDLSDLVVKAQKALSALHDLGKTDLSCLDPGPAGGSAGAASPGSSSAGAPDPQPQAPSGPRVSREGLVEVHRVLSLIPTPLTLERLLPVLADALLSPELGALRVPLLTDLGETGQTLLAWQAMSPDEVREYMAQTLRELDAYLRKALDAPLAVVGSALGAVATQLPADDLLRIATGLSTQLQALALALPTGSLAGTAASIQAAQELLDQYEAIVKAQAGPQSALSALPALPARLAALPEALDEEMGRVAAALALAPAQDLLPAALALLPGVLPDRPLGDLEPFLDGILDWLNQLLQAIDLVALKAPIRALSTRLSELAASLEQATLTLTTAVTQKIEEAGALLALFDPAALVAQLEAAMQGLAGRFTELVAPIRQGLQRIHDAMAEGLSGFHPEELAELLRTQLRTLSGLISDPAVMEVLRDAKGALGDLTELVSKLPFSQITAAIDALLEQLKDLKPDALPEPAKALLGAALSALPQDLSVVVQPTDHIASSIEQGLIAVLRSAENQLSSVRDRIQAFHPAALVRGSLSAPYQDLLQRIEGFAPEHLLEPVQAPVRALRKALEDHDPTRAFAGAAPLLIDLRRSIESLSPDALLLPVETALTAATSELRQALPVEGLAAVAERAVSQVADIAALSDSGLELLRRAHGLLEETAGLRGELDTLAASLSRKLDGISDTAPLQPLLDQIGQAVQALTATELKTRLAALYAPAQQVLRTLDPGARLGALRTAYAGIPRAAVQALPSSAEKTALLGLLDRFDPTKSGPDAWASPYADLAAVRIAIDEAAPPQALSGWDDRHHARGSALDALRGLQVSPDRLRGWVREALEAQLISPISTVLELMAPLRKVAGAFLGRFTELVSALRQRVSGLLQGPGSIAGLRGELAELVQRIGTLPFDGLKQVLRELRQQILAKLDALDPEKIALAFRSSRDAVLRTLDPGALFPTESWNEMVSKLRELDPGRLIGDALQAEFEELMTPLLEALDLRAVLAALLDKLRELPEALRESGARLDRAYRDLRTGLPSGSLTVNVSAGGAG